MPCLHEQDKTSLGELLMIIMFWCACTHLMADEKENDALPAIELLEFLGEWQSDDGKDVFPEWLLETDNVTDTNTSQQDTNMETQAHEASR